MAKDIQTLAIKELLEEIHKWDKEIGGGVMPSSMIRLLKYGPEVGAGYWLMRKSVMMEPPEGALARWVKELIIVAVEVALRLPWGGGSHARNAIRLGANVKQVHEAVEIALIITGMSTYVGAGQTAVEAAEEEEKLIE